MLGDKIFPSPALPVQVRWVSRLYRDSQPVLQAPLYLDIIILTALKFVNNAILKSDYEVAN